MAAMQTDRVAEILAWVRRANPSESGPPRTPVQKAEFREGFLIAWHMLTFGLADAMAADHPRWDRDRFFDLADGVDVL